MLIDSSHHCIAKLPRFHAVPRIPIDAGHIVCDQSETHHDYGAIETILHNFPAAFVVNIDKNGVKNGLVPMPKSLWFRIISRSDDQDTHIENQTM
jgi:hypothetical protein